MVTEDGLKVKECKSGDGFDVRVEGEGAVQDEAYVTDLGE